MSAPLQLQEMDSPARRRRRTKRRRTLADAVTIVLLSAIALGLAWLLVPTVGAVGCAAVDVLSPILSKWSL